MARLLILADDFTGAMDTGVQFAKLGIKTRVGTDVASLLVSSLDAVVLVADTETRHLSPTDAYQKVYREARAGREAGIQALYKKTDSALRGNVGAELSAVIAGWGAKSLPFIPAYPKIGRITRNGIHYIGDLPVSESAFGKDPFSPVLCSDVAAWLARQSCVPVIRAGGTPFPEPFIEVYDAGTDEDLSAIAESLKAGGSLHLLAGCAGMASVLPKMLGLNGEAVKAALSTGRLLVLCGSVHPVTKEQICFAVDKGARHIRLTPAQKLGRDGWKAPEYRALIAQLAALCREDAPVIVDANDEGNETMAYAASLGMTLPDVRAAVSAALGNLGKGLLMAGVDSTLLITGGDTLMSFLDAFGICSIQPVGELAPGIVRASFEVDGITHDMITKSGGFGEKHLLWQLAGQMRNEKGEILHHGGDRF